MKKNDWIYISSILLYSLLFWKEAAGLNFLIFNFVLVVATIIKDRTVIRSRNWGLAATGSFIAAASVFLYGDSLSIFANLFSLLLLSAFVVDKQNSLLVSLLQSVCNMAVVVAYMATDGIKRRQKRKAELSNGTGTGKRTIIVLISLLVVILFFILYRNSNVLFYKLTEDINLRFISIPWCLFTLMGAYLLYGFYNYHALPGLSEWDSKQPIALQRTEEISWMDRLMSMPSERFSGLVLLALLNLLLLVVNMTDLTFMCGGVGLPAGVSHSEYVHQGVGALIVSIILAMVIILFYFRGRMNFDTQSRSLRLLAILWILQNAFMLISTASRNQLYVDSYGLTYKRIGVYIYLLLALIGLITVGWKVLKIKTNIWLVRANSWLFYFVLILSCTISWDKWIAKDNLRLSKGGNQEYLFGLSEQVYPYLTHFSYIDINGYTKSVHANVFAFMQRQQYITKEQKWPSLVLSRQTVWQQLQKRSVNNDVLFLDAGNKNIHQVYFIPQYANVETLVLTSNELKDLGELGLYKRIKIMNLNDNSDLESISGIEGMDSLEELHLINTNVQDFAPLLKLKNLNVLHVERISNEWEVKLRRQFPGIQIKEDGFLRKFF
jgi:Domain of unknown function (DUF4173)